MQTFGGGLTQDSEDREKIAIYLSLTEKILRGLSFLRRASHFLEGFFLVHGYLVNHHK